MLNVRAIHVHIPNIHAKSQALWCPLWSQLDTETGRSWGFTIFEHLGSGWWYHLEVVLEAWSCWRKYTHPWGWALRASGFQFTPLLHSLPSPLLCVCGWRCERSAACSCRCVCCLPWCFLVVMDSYFSGTISLNEVFLMLPLLMAFHHSNRKETKTTILKVILCYRWLNLYFIKMQGIGNILGPLLFDHRFGKLGRLGVKHPGLCVLEHLVPSCQCVWGLVSPVRGRA